MKYATFLASIISTVALTNAYPAAASLDASQICTKACQAAPTDQREVCMRVCTQFAEQSAGFKPATASASPMSTRSASVESPAPTNAKEKQQTELGDVGTDASDSEASESHSEPMSSSAAAVQIGSAVLAIAL
ncbi:hypothetical protein H4R20_004472, partial [Coemansia guatemalensis]